MNEALSELYIEDEDHEKLRESVDDYDNFDQVSTLGQALVAVVVVVVVVHGGL